MTLTREQIRTAALNLDPTDREALAEELLLSLSQSERDMIDAAWLTEAKRRDADFTIGKATAKPVDQVIHRLKNGSRP